MRVATNPALTRGWFNPPLWTPDLLAWKCPKEPEPVTEVWIESLDIWKTGGEEEEEKEPWESLDY